MRRGFYYGVTGVPARPLLPNRNTQERSLSTITPSKGPEQWAKSAPIRSSYNELNTGDTADL